MMRFSAGTPPRMKGYTMILPGEFWVADRRQLKDAWAKCIKPQF